MLVVWFPIVNVDARLSDRKSTNREEGSRARLYAYLHVIIACCVATVINHPESGIKYSDGSDVGQDE